MRCRNLASHVPGRLLRCLAADFAARHGFEPWLVETFVEPPHDGASLRAANWRRLGETAGRGRQDRRHDVAAGRKVIHVYELAQDWHVRPGVDPPPADTLKTGEGLDGPSWAAAEFGEASLGDARLTARLVTIARLKGARPMMPFTQAAHRELAAIKGDYASSTGATRRR